MHSLLVLFLATATAQSQDSIVSFGVKGGIPLTEAVSTQMGIGLSSINTGRWTVGSTVELHLPWRLSIEFDALYRTFQYGYISTFSQYSYIPPGTGVAQILPPTINTFNQDTTVWDFPLLLKYRFPGEKVRPFLVGGKSWSRESRKISWSSVCSAGGSSCFPPDFPSVPSPNYSFSSQTVVRDGAVAGAGVEFKYRRLSFSPELRFMRIAQPRNIQATILFGITF